MSWLPTLSVADPAAKRQHSFRMIIHDVVYLKKMKMHDFLSAIPPKSS